MNVNRNTESLSGLKDRPEFLVIQILAARMGIDDRSLEAERLHAPFEFFRGTSRILRRNGCQSGKPVAMALNRICQKVIARPGERRALGRVEHLHAGRSKGKNLPRNSSRVHVAEA